MAFTMQQIYRNYVALLCVLFAVVLALCLILISANEQRQGAKATLTLQAKMLAGVLGNESRISATGSRDLLPTIGQNPRLVLACVYDADDRLKSFMRGAAHSKRINPPLTCHSMPEGNTFSSFIVVSVPVVRSSLPEPIGELVLVGAVPPLWDHALSWAFISVLLTLLLALFCWALGIRLDDTLIKPIRQIASTAQRVSLYKDYTLRVVPGVLDVVPQEVQSLTSSFNAMLKEIEDRDGRLSRKSAELDRARQTAEAANNAKSQFLANVSHELRTPLNAIIGFSTMLANEQFGPMGEKRYVEYARDIQDSGKHLLDVINDILDLTKAETGKLSVTFTSVNLSKVVGKALRIIEGQAHQRKIDIYTDIPEKLPKIIADPVRLIQMLLNLLSNAIKFTEEGGKVVVRARAEPGRQGIHYFTITVEDTGIGMSEAAIRRAFSSFNQADAGLNRKYEGAGLGLPLTKRLVDLHHGKIKIESEEGKGTVVTIRLTSDPALLD